MDVLADPAAWTLYPDAGRPPHELPGIERVVSPASPAERVMILGIPTVIALGFLVAFAQRVGPITAAIVLLLLAAGTASPPARSAFAWVRRWSADMTQRKRSALASRGLGLTEYRTTLGTVATHPAELLPSLEQESPLGVTAVITGRTWAAAAGTRVEVMTYGSGENNGSITVVTISLPSEVATRFSGLVIRGARCLVNGVERVRLRRRDELIEVEFGAIEYERCWQLLRMPEQPELNVFELCSPPFMERLAAWYQGGQFSWAPTIMIVDGHMVLTVDADLQASMRGPWSPGSPEAQPSLDALLMCARDVHRRLVEEWQ